ncbi:zinc finger protein 271-like isoform X2 [Daphnia pulex]|nr:zinc finger protein 271-like isoform X2 [Daphnia pulex]
MENATLEASLRVEFRESRVGNEMLLINGCKYMVNRRSGDTTYWRCIYSWCHCRAVFKGGQLRSARGTHVCPQPLQNETANKNKLQLQSNSEVTQMIVDVDTIPSKSLDSTDYIIETETSEANSFLEFVEDKSVSIKTETPDEDLNDVDFAWKQRILKGLKVYSEAEQHRRFKIAYDNRKAWIDNRKHFTEKISGCIKKWATGKSRWTFCNDWPTRSQCMKLIKPERGSGVLVEQPLVPIKIIEHVNPPPQLSTESTEKSVDSDLEPVIKKESVKRHEGKVNEIVNSSEKNLGKNKAYKSFRNEGKCPICGKVFQSSLERHLNVHYGIKPYKCDRCDKTFSQEHSYRSHVRLHNSDKPFSCTICPKKFTSNGTLKRHITSHSNGRTFPCNNCGKVFRKSEFLHFHTFKCHPQKELASEMISDIDGESGTKLAIRGKTSTPRKRRIARNFNEEDEEYPTNLSKRRGLVKEEQGERREQTQHIYMDKKGESSRSSKRQFTLEELK